MPRIKVVLAVIKTALAVIKTALAVIKTILAVIKTVIGKLCLRPKWRREFLEGLGG